MDYCLELSGSEPYKDENISSIPATVKDQRKRLQDIFNTLVDRV
jgi:hypothetical protein